MPNKSKKSPIVHMRMLRILERVRIERIRSRQYTVDEVPYPPNLPMRTLYHAQRINNAELDLTWLAPVIGMLSALLLSMY